MEKRIKQTKRKPLKIVVCGPESSGKSTLTKNLAEHYNTVYSEEFLRNFASEIYSRGESILFEDNLEIIKGQLLLEERASSNTEKFFFCDTDLLQTIIYSKVYFKKVQKELLESFERNMGDYYLLLKPDIRWEYDELRDEEVDRNHIYSLLKEELDFHKIKYFEIEGLGENRLKNAIESLDKVLQ